MVAGYRAIPELMCIHDVPVVFTVVAHTNAPYLGYGAESQLIRVIKTRHEETAIAAASAYTRVSGRLGVAERRAWTRVRKFG